MDSKQFIRFPLVSLKLITMRGRRPVRNQDDDSSAAATEEAFLDGLQDLVLSGVDIQHLIIFGTLNPRLTKGGCCKPPYGFPVALKR